MKFVLEMSRKSGIKFSCDVLGYNLMTAVRFKNHSAMKLIFKTAKESGKIISIEHFYNAWYEYTVRKIILTFQ